MNRPEQQSESVKNSGSSLYFVLCEATGGAGFFVRSFAIPNDACERKKGAEPFSNFINRILNDCIFLELKKSFSALFRSSYVKIALKEGLAEYSVCAKHEIQAIVNKGSSLMALAMCAGLAAYAERLWQPRHFWYFLWQCQKVHKEKLFLARQVAFIFTIIHMSLSLLAQRK